nr:hypothetical protein Iba_chr02dCG2730 [Ipomoea batatas]
MRLQTVKALLYRMGFWCGHDRKRKRRGRMGLICSGGNVKVKVRRRRRANGGGLKVSDGKVPDGRHQFIGGRIPKPEGLKQQ